MKLGLDADEYFALSRDKKDEVDEWLAAQGPFQMIFEYELLDEGGRRLRLSRYKWNADGKRYIDRDTGEAAREDIEVTVATPPPIVLAR